MSQDNKDAIDVKGFRVSGQQSDKTADSTFDSILIRTNQVLKWSMENPGKAAGIAVVGLISLKSAGVRKTLKWVGSSVGTMVFKDII